jgi:hypothetical protein
MWRVSEPRPPIPRRSVVTHPTNDQPSSPDTREVSPRFAALSCQLPDGGTHALRFWLPSTKVTLAAQLDSFSTLRLRLQSTFSTHTRKQYLIPSTWFTHADPAGQPLSAVQPCRPQ